MNKEEILRNLKDKNNLPKELQKEVKKKISQVENEKIIRK